MVPLSERVSRVRDELAVRKLRRALVPDRTYHSGPNRGTPLAIFAGAMIGLAISGALTPDHPKVVCPEDVSGGDKSTVLVADPGGWSAYRAGERGDAPNENVIYVDPSCITPSSTPS